VTVDKAIESEFGVREFATFENETYAKYQEIAEQEIIDKLAALLSANHFLALVKQWGIKCGCSYKENRTVTIRLKSGKTWDISSPVFLRAKPKGKRGRKPKRQKGTIRHLGLELLGIVYRLSPALVEVCVSMAVLCPSFEVAANALRGLGVTMNECLLQKITGRFAGLAKNNRVECNGEEIWKHPGNRILICVDGGRIRERRKKRGKRRKDLKRQGYHTEWFEPRLLTISLFDENGQKIKAVNPILDGSCGTMDDFFELLKDYLLWLNLDEAAEIIFCADGGNGIWPGIDKLICDLELSNAKRILDYTHAQQNINIVKKAIIETLNLTQKEQLELSVQLKELLWSGSIDGISALVQEKLADYKNALTMAMKKMNGYFGDQAKFQYKAFRDNGLPTGSGTVESAIRRIINLRIKGTGLFWKRENAENVIFLRSLVLTGKIRNACHKALKIGRTMFDQDDIYDLPMAV